MPNNLPPNWSWVKLGDVCEIVMGQSPPSSTYNTEKKGLPFFQGKAEFTELYPIVRKWCSEPNKIAEPLDILVSVRAPVGSSNIANHKCCIGRGLAALRYPDCNKYIFYFIRLIETELDKLGTGSTFKAISSSTLKNVEIPLPPLPEQKKIVEKIEELFSQLESGVAPLKKAKEQLRLYRQSVLAAAFSGRLLGKDDIFPVQDNDTKDVIFSGKAAEPLVEYKDNGLPKGWKWVKVSDVGEIVTGTTPSKKNSEYYGNDFPLFKPTDLNAGINTREALDNISKIGATKARLLPEKSVMVTCIGATIGKTGMNKQVGATNQQINSIIISDKFIQEFVYYFCISEFFQKQIKDHASSTTLPILNKSKFESLPFVEAPKNEQAKIVEEIEKRFSEADNLEKAIDESLEKADRLKQSILKKAFEGRLV